MCKRFGGRSGVKTFDWHAICSYQGSLDLRDFQVDISRDAFMDSVEKPPQSSVFYLKILGNFPTFPNMDTIPPFNLWLYVEIFPYNLFY